MSDRTLKEVMEDLRKIAGDDTNLLIYLPGKDGPIATKTNVYKEAYVCPVCGKALEYYNSFCGCGWYNPNMPTTITC